MRLYYNMKYPSVLVRNEGPDVSTKVNGSIGEAVVAIAIIASLSGAQIGIAFSNGITLVA